MIIFDDMDAPAVVLSRSLNSRFPWNRFVSLVLFFSALSVLTLSAQTGRVAAPVIRMAWFPVPPHVYASEDGGAPTGPTIDLFNAIAKRMGYKVEWVGPLPIYRLGIYQKTGEMNLDGAIMHMKSPVTLSLLYFPSRPFFMARPSIAIRIDNPLMTVQSINDIRGYRIGFVKTLAGGYPPLIDEHRNQLVMDELSGQDWTRRNLNKLLAGRLDAVYERNQYSLPYQAAMDGVEDQIKVLSFPSAPIPYYFVFHRTSPQGFELLEKYEKAVAGMEFDYDALVLAEMKRLRAHVGKRGHIGSDRVRESLFGPPLEEPWQEP